jgi:small subunit ribosomal protein S10
VSNSTSHPDKVETYDHRLLDQSVAEIVKSTRGTGAKVIGPIPLPTTDRVHDPAFTSCDKKSQDQFQMLVHKRLIDIMNPTSRPPNALKKLSCRPVCMWRSKPIPGARHVGIDWKENRNDPGVDSNGKVVPSTVNQSGTLSRG